MPGIILFVALLATISVLTLRKPHIALVAVLCMFGLEQLGQIYIPYIRTHSQFTNLFVLVLLVLAISLAYFRGNVSLSFNLRGCKVRAISMALYALAFLSLIWTPVDGWSYWANQWPYVIALVVLAPLLIGSVSDLEEVQKAFVWIGGILITFLAYVPDWGTRSLAFEGTSEETGIPLALAQLSGYLLITAAIHLRGNYVSIGWLSFVAVSALVVAFKTGSRGQVIFSIASFLLVLPLIWRRFALRHALQLIATGTLIVLASIYIFQATDANVGRWQAGRLSGAVSGRFELARALMSVWIESPPWTILIGLGNSASFSPEIIGRYCHIVALEVLGEEGILGFALFVAIIVLSVRQAIAFKSLEFLHRDVKRVYAAVFGCFIFTLLISFKQGSLINSPSIFLFAVMAEKYTELVRRRAYSEYVETQPNEVAHPDATQSAV